jgi:hypothetical protein
LASALREFFVAVTDWLVAGYEARSMHRMLSDLASDEQAEFARTRQQLAESLVRAAQDPPDVVKVDLVLWDGEIPKIASDLQVLRGLVQASVGSLTKAHSDRLCSGALSDDTCFCVLVPMFPQRSDKDGTLVLFCYERDTVHIWARQNRSKLWLDATRLLEGQDQEQFFSEIDALVEASEGGAGLCFSDVSQRSSVLAIVDLSSKNVPLSLLEDDRGRFTFVMNCPGPSLARDRRERPNIYYWGGMIDVLNENTVINDDLRVVECEAQHGPVRLQHPDVPNPDVYRFASRSGPLALSHFERWDFESCQRLGRCDVVCNTGRKATRTAFLEYDWRKVDVLHISTHARAIAGTPEFAHLDMYADCSGAGVIHSFDILSLDFSNLQLVFLSACQTKLGSQWTGNEDLSLAWAFRAAGAEAVIGMRWEVSEAAAWYFSHCFYDAWLGERRLPLRESFRAAQQAVRSHPYFLKPNLWGAFVLLD